MLKNISKSLTLSCILFLFSCGGTSQSEYNNPNKTQTNVEVTPEKLLSQAKVNIEHKYYNFAMTKLEELVNKHPDTEQAKEAKKLFSIVQKKMKAKQTAEANKLDNETKKLDNATKKLRKEYDDIKEITWYYDKGTPKTYYKDYLNLYISKEKTGMPSLLFHIQYTSGKWLFIESYIIKTDNNSYSISPSYGEIERDNSSGSIVEWYDVAMNQKIYNMVKDIASSKKVKLRCNGEHYYNDRLLSKEEKEGIKNVLEGYRILGGSSYFY